MSTQPGAGHVPEWTLGDKLRKVRHLMGMTQREFAKAIGVGEGTYPAYETGASNPRGADLVDIARRVAAVTGVSAAWIIGLDDEGPGPGVSRTRGHLRSLPRPASIREPSDSRRWNIAA